ncbi:MAG: chemotaxis protein CheW [Anaerolineaceae bacterium]|nr:chemotaxis protein CheW [Anaerolineaceae bacterium]
MEKQLVVFNLDSEDYGVDITSVESIIKMQAITSIPQAPAVVEGVTNLRGMVLPVINLRKRFGLKNGEIDKNTRIIVSTMNGLKVGMIVDGVSEVLRIQDQVIESTPPMVSTVDTAFITGIIKLDGRLVILLDLARVLNIEEQNELRIMPVMA